jgi:hypothetical protein
MNDKKSAKVEIIGGEPYELQEIFEPRYVHQIAIDTGPPPRIANKAENEHKRGVKRLDMVRWICKAKFIIYFTGEGPDESNPQQRLFDSKEDDRGGYLCDVSINHWPPKTLHYEILVQDAQDPKHWTAADPSIIIDVVRRSALAYVRVQTP